MCQRVYTSERVVMMKIRIEVCALAFTSLLNLSLRLGISNEPNVLWLLSRTQKHRLSLHTISTSSSVILTICESQRDTIYVTFDSSL